MPVLWEIYGQDLQVQSTAIYSCLWAEAVLDKQMYRNKGKQGNKKLRREIIRRDILATYGSFIAPLPTPPNYLPFRRRML